MAQETAADATDRKVAALKAAVIPYTQYPGILASLRAALLYEAEGLYGRRNLDWTIGPTSIRPIPSPMAARPDPTRPYIEVWLSECEKHPDRLLFQLAHEVVHLLSPNHTKPTLRIEEGLAVHFSRLIMMRVSPGYDTRATAAENYLAAADDFDLIHALNPNFVYEARVETADLHAFTPDLLLRQVPRLDPAIADRLCEPFNYSSPEPVGAPA